MSYIKLSLRGMVEGLAKAGGASPDRKGDPVTLDRVSEVINEVANEIMERLESRAEFASDLDSGIVDALNLMINASMHLLAKEADSLEEVAELAYNESLDTILGWIEDV